MTFSAFGTGTWIVLQLVYYSCTIFRFFYLLRVRSEISERQIRNYAQAGNGTACYGAAYVPLSGIVFV